MSKSHDKSGADLPGLGADLPGLGADFAGHWFWDLCKSGLKTTTHDLGFTRQLTHKYGVKLPTHDLVCSSVSPGHEQNSTDILVVAVNFSRCSRNFDWCCDGTSITGLVHRNPEKLVCKWWKTGLAYRIPCPVAVIMIFNKKSMPWRTGCVCFLDTLSAW